MGNTAAISPCGMSKAIRVIQPDGKVMLITGGSTSVADLLLTHPHHYLCKAGREKQNPTGSMLPLEMVLEPGHKYLLLPLPRLFSVRSLTRRRSVSSSRCCISLVAGGFPESDTEDSDDYLRTVRTSSSLGKQQATESCCKGLRIKLTYCKGRGSPARTTPMTNEMRHILKCAEQAWKEMNEMTGAWRPELDSINEEASIKRSPMRRQTLASLMGINFTGNGYGSNGYKSV